VRSTVKSSPCLSLIEFALDRTVPQTKSGFGRQDTGFWRAANMPVLVADDHPDSAEATALSLDLQGFGTVTAWDRSVRADPEFRVRLTRCQ
jgi:hypothetical protein